MMAAQHLATDPEIVMEGRETDDFWAVFAKDGKGFATESTPPGKEKYATSDSAAAVDAPDPRLFQCSNNKGYFYAEEVFDFAQEDLCVDDVMLLDAFADVFIWIGERANAEERKGALELAKTYIEKDGSGRDAKDTCFQVLKQGMEPPNFTCHFFGWKDGKFGGGKTYEELKAEMQAKNPDAGSMTMSLDDELNKYQPGGTILALDVLLGMSAEELVKKHPEIDATKKEDYLSDEDFEKAFKMKREDYMSKPAWKRTGLRKAAGLF
jgi:hypothetical protein